MSGVNNNKKKIMVKYLELFDKDKASAFNVYLADENGEEYRVALWDGKERGLNVDFLVSKDKDFEVFPMLDDGRLLIGEKRLFTEVDRNELDLETLKVVRINENRKAICRIKEIRENLVETGMCLIVKDNDLFEVYANKIISTFNVVRDATNEEIELFNDRTRVYEKTKYKPFDKVLLRDEEDEYWKPGFFWKIGKDGSYISTDGLMFNHCIPYEGNEDKLTIS